MSNTVKKGMIHNGFVLDADRLIRAEKEMYFFLFCPLSMTFVSAAPHINIEGKCVLGKYKNITHKHDETFYLHCSRKFYFFKMIPLLTFFVLYSYLPFLW